MSSFFDEAVAKVEPGTLFLNDNGEVACVRHGGAYLATSVHNKPKARLHRTPLGTWERMSPAEQATLSAEDRQYVVCEGCTRG